MALFKMKSLQNCHDFNKSVKIKKGEVMENKTSQETNNERCIIEKSLVQQ